SVCCSAYNTSAPTYHSNPKCRFVFLTERKYHVSSVLCAVCSLPARSGRRRARKNLAARVRGRLREGGRPLGADRPERLEGDRDETGQGVQPVPEGQRLQAATPQPVSHRPGEGHRGERLRAPGEVPEHGKGLSPPRPVPVLRPPGPGPLLLCPPGQANRRPRQPDIHRQCG